jgi:hypothetical protein
MSDKYAVRNYVREKLPVDIFPRLYLVTDNPSDIRFRNLPERLVIKPTHASNWVSIVQDKSLVSEKELREECQKWLRRSYYDVSKEWVYKNIPRRLLVEELLEDGTAEVPRDYKFFVFAGKVQLIQVDIDRFRGHRRNLYDRHWNRLDVSFVYDTYGGALTRPNRLAEMIEYAEVLGDGLEFVRVDFYDLGSRVVFGEMTTPPGKRIWEVRPGIVRPLPGRLVGRVCRRLSMKKSVSIRVTLCESREWWAESLSIEKCSMPE